MQKRKKKRNAAKSLTTRQTKDASQTTYAFTVISISTDWLLQ